MAQVFGEGIAKDRRIVIGGRVEGDLPVLGPLIGGHGPDLTTVIAAVRACAGDRHARLVIGRAVAAGTGTQAVHRHPAQVHQVLNLGRQGRGHAGQGPFRRGAAPKQVQPDLGLSGVRGSNWHLQRQNRAPALMQKGVFKHVPRIAARAQCHAKGRFGGQLHNRPIRNRGRNVKFQRGRTGFGVAAGAEFDFLGLFGQAQDLCGQNVVAKCRCHAGRPD